MDVLFINTLFVFCFIFHLALSAQPEINDQFTNEIKKLNDKVSYLMNAVEKIENDILKIELKDANSTATHVSLNEAVENLSSLIKINSNEINSIRQCLKRSGEECGQGNKTLELNMCNITDPLQLFNMSSDTLAYSWGNINTSNLIKKENKIIESEVFALSKFNMNAQVKLEIRYDGSVWSYLCFLKKQLQDTWTLKALPRVNYVMKAEKNGHIREMRIDSDDINHFGSTLSYGEYGYAGNFEYFYFKPEPKYEVGETLSVEVYVDTPEMSNLFYSDNGTVKGTICPYNKISEWKSNRTFALLYSPYFLTSPKGYRARLGFDFNDSFSYKENTNEWLSVCFSFLTGPYDLFLKHPRSQGTITLINQIDPSKSITKFKESTSVDLWFPFETLSNKSEFVVNDQLMYNASLEILN